MDRSLSLAQTLWKALYTFFPTALYSFSKWRFWLWLWALGIMVYQFTENYITNANTVPMLILYFLYDFRGTWQADQAEALWQTDKMLPRGWLVCIPALPTNPRHLNINQGRIKHWNTHCRPGAVAKPVVSCPLFYLFWVKCFVQLTKGKVQDKKVF